MNKKNDDLYVVKLLENSSKRFNVGRNRNSLNLLRTSKSKSTLKKSLDLTSALGSIHSSKINVLGTRNTRN